MKNCVENQYLSNTAKVIASGMIITVLCLFGSALAQSNLDSAWVPGQPRFVAIPRGDAQKALAESLAATNVPLWSGSFTFSSVTYHFTMVGSNPALGSATSRITPVIVPLKFAFSNGTTLSATSIVCSGTKTAVALTKQSPILKNHSFAPGGTNVGSTQYVDAFQRANFWKQVSTVSPNYHVLLCGPATSTNPCPVPVQPLQTITVDGNGGTVPGPCARIGEMDINAFDSIAQSLITKLGIPATSLPIFLGYNTFLTFNGGCCILGYHSATSANHTYLYAAYSDPNIFSAPIEDIHALSHEVGEWMDDPFINNIVPAWGHVGQVSGCQNNLEVGDPVTGIAFTVTMPNGIIYHPEDLVFKSWFARQKPSTAVNGWYTFLNTFSSPQPVCT